MLTFQVLFKSSPFLCFVVSLENHDAMCFRLECALGLLKWSKLWERYVSYIDHVVYRNHENILRKAKLVKKPLDILMVIFLYFTGVNQRCRWNQRYDFVWEWCIRCKGGLLGFFWRVKEYQFNHEKVVGKHFLHPRTLMKKSDQVVALVAVMFRNGS